MSVKKRQNQALYADLELDDTILCQFETNASDFKRKRTRSKA